MAGSAAGRPPAPRAGARERLTDLRPAGPPPHGPVTLCGPTAGTVAGVPPTSPPRHRSELSLDENQNHAAAPRRPGWSGRRRHRDLRACRASSRSAAGLDLNNGTPTPFHLAKVGPVNQLDGLPDSDPLHDASANGFPYWYSDGTTPSSCAWTSLPARPTTARSPAPSPTPTPRSRSRSMTDGPGNFPDEAFYWMATGGGAIGTGANAGRSLVVMALEAAFANEIAQPGDQMVFARTRLRIDIPVDGQYTVVSAVRQEGLRRHRRPPDDQRHPGRRHHRGAVHRRARRQHRPVPALGLLGAGTRPRASSATPARCTTSPARRSSTAAAPPTSSASRPRPARQLRTAGGANPCPDRPTATNCVEYPQFTVLGKQAARKGVEATRATYTRHGDSTNIDLFGYSAPGAHLQAAGSGIPSTDLNADEASGFYFARLGQATAGFDPAADHPAAQPHRRARHALDRAPHRRRQDRRGDVLQHAERRAREGRPRRLRPHVGRPERGTADRRRRRQPARRRRRRRPAYRHLRRRPRCRHLGAARPGQGDLGDGRLGQHPGDDRR